MRCLHFIFVVWLVLPVGDVASAASLRDCLGLFKRSGTPQAREYYSDLVQNVHVQMRVRNEAAKLQVLAAGSDAKSVKVVTLNAGLLNAKVLGFVDISVPRYEQRANLYPTKLKEFVTREEPDFFFLQEVWHPRDIDAIRLAIAPFGYEIMSSTKSHDGWFPLGLHTIIRKTNGHNVVENETNVSRLTTLKEKIAGIHRGSLSTTVHQADGTRLLLVNSHLTFAEGNTAHRLDQLSDISASTDRKRNTFDYLILGADTNSSDVFPASENTPKSKWYVDKEVYLSIDENFNSLNIIDTYRANHQNESGYTQDPEQNALTRESPTTRTEPQQRLDYILAGTSKPEGAIYAQSSDIVFRDTMDGDVNYSDHFGVMSQLAFLPTTHHVD